MTIASMVLLLTVENRIAFMIKLVTAAACIRVRMHQAVRKKVRMPTYDAFVALVDSSRAFSSCRCTSTRICLPMKRFVR